MAIVVSFPRNDSIFEPGHRDPATGNIVETSPNIRWAARIGSPTYATPIVTHGKALNHFTAASSAFFSMISATFS